MKCLNCGVENDSQSTLCSNCGTLLLNNKDENNIVNNTDNVQNDNVINNNIISNQKVQNDNSNQNNYEFNMFETYNPENSIVNKTLKFLKTNRKVLLIVLISFVAFIIGYKIYDNITDGTKLSWTDNEEYKINVVTPSGSVNLSVEAFDEHNNEISDISFNVSGGDIKVDGTKVEWILPKEEGKYTISAKAPSGKKIKKNIEVKELKDLEDRKNLSTIYEKDKNDDYDSDGLKNDEEKKYGTNDRLKDTDHDGISDYEEINKTKTNPLKVDSDGDKLNDSDELALGYDPLKEDTKGDGVKDGDRNLTYNTKYNNEVSLQINGKGNLASTTTIDVFENTAFDKVKGISNKVYVFHTSSKMENATVEIKYSIDDINKKGLNENNLVLYYFNEETKKFEPQKTVLDAKNKTVKANLSHFSKYVLGDTTLVSDSNSFNIMFVIDNSVSMYSKKQMDDAGYTRSTGAVGNDTEFKRLTLSSDLVNKFTGKYKFGVAEFSGNYVNIEKFTEDKNKTINSINSLKAKWKSNISGTNIIGALENGITEFANKDESNYLILLTDGKNTTGTITNTIQNNIIKKAKEKDVRICTIGLGKVDSSELKNISQQTGCDFYSASSSSTLDDVYNKLGADINYNLVDTDDDNKIDGTILADSGFIVTRDGFPFENYSSKQSKNGHCYGMATFAMLYYTKQLPMKLNEITTETGLIVNTKELKSSGYNLSGTYFSSFKNLYDYELKDEALKLYMQGEAPSDYRYQDGDDKWKIRSKYIKMFNDSGFNKFEENNYEKFRLDIDSDNYKNNVNKDDRELFNAIWRLYVLQLEDEIVSFTSEPDEAYNTLYKNLKNGVPIVLNITFNTNDGESASHSVNAVRLIQRNDDPNDLAIEIYDNNYPGQRKYIDLQRYKSNFNAANATTWYNDYEYVMVYDNKLLYSDSFFNTKGIEVTVSKLNIK